MAKDICHVFPDRASVTRHLNDVFSSDAESGTFYPTHSVYTMKNGDKHFCFAIRDRDDIQQFLGYEFFSHELHGTFEHLNADDAEFLRGMLKQRTRHAPEAQ